MALDLAAFTRRVENEKETAVFFQTVSAAARRKFYITRDPVVIAATVQPVTVGAISVQPTAVDASRSKVAIDASCREEAIAQASTGIDRRPLCFARQKVMRLKRQ